MSQIINPVKLECSQCFNDRNFTIEGIERVAETPSWNVLIRCPYCFTGQNVRYEPFHFYDRLLQHLKKTITIQKNKERPTSYKEFCYKTNKVYRDTHPDGLYEVLR